MENLDVMVLRTLRDWREAGHRALLATVVRYFGGVKLGAGGLVRAYTDAVAQALLGADTVPLQRGPDLAEFGRLVRAMVDLPSMTGQMVAIDGGQHLAWQTPDVVGGGAG